MVNVIAIDGPASSGKGTVARIVAKRLGFKYLESGAIYRALALLVYDTYGELQPSENQVINLIDQLNLQFKDNLIFVNNYDVTNKLRQDFIGMLASKYSKIPLVRERLLNLQRSFLEKPGLVTDGRDMGSVVFPDAQLKVFLTASKEVRAMRRYKQLHQIDRSVKIDTILRDIIARDVLDSSRGVAPLGFDSSYKLLDNSNLTIDETVEQILLWYSQVA